MDVCSTCTHTFVVACHILWHMECFFFQIHSLKNIYSRSRERTMWRKEAALSPQKREGERGKVRAESIIIKRWVMWCDDNIYFIYFISTSCTFKCNGKVKLCTILVFFSNIYIYMRCDHSHIHFAAVNFQFHFNDGIIWMKRMMRRRWATIATTLNVIFYERIAWVGVVDDDDDNDNDDDATGGKNCMITQSTFTSLKNIHMNAEAVILICMWF